LIIELLRSIIKKVGSPSINIDIKDSLITTYRDIFKVFKVKHKGILSLLNMFGDAEAMVREEKPKPLPIIEREVPV